MMSKGKDWPVRQTEKKEAWNQGTLWESLGNTRIELVLLNWTWVWWTHNAEKHVCPNWKLQFEEKKLYQEWAKL